MNFFFIRKYKSFKFYRKTGQHFAFLNNSTCIQNVVTCIYVLNTTSLNDGTCAPFISNQQKEIWSLKDDESKQMQCMLA